MKSAWTKAHQKHQKASKKEKGIANTNHPNKTNPPTPLESWIAPAGTPKTRSQPKPRPIEAP